MSKAKTVYKALDRAFTRSSLLPPLTHTIPDLYVMEQLGQLTLPLDQILESFMHMHLNRLLWIRPIGRTTRTNLCLAYSFGSA
jgi:hypothetical protein